MCQIEKFGASPFRYVRTDIEVHGEERVLTVHNRAAIPIITKRFACYDTPSFYSPVRKEPRDKKQKNRKIQDKQGQAHDRAPKKRSQERESETKPKQKKRGDYLLLLILLLLLLLLLLYPPFRTSPTRATKCFRTGKRKPRTYRMRGFLFSNP